MHAIFFPYGTRQEVEVLLRDMEAQKFKWPMWKGEKKKVEWICGRIRQLPFGFYEYIFPQEYANDVLTTLGFVGDRYNVGHFKQAILRKMTRCKPIPEFEKKKAYLWIQDYVNVLLLGIREDVITHDISGKFKGWTHEAL